MSKHSGFITRRVLAWASWDMGSSSFSAVVTTFVFSVYITNDKIFGPEANANLGWMTALSGIVVALVAPAIGQWTDRTGRVRTVLAISTFGVVAIMACLFFVKPSIHYVWLGLALIALGNLVIELGSVVYNSLVGEFSTEKTVGRVSGFGWGMGYLGSIILLVILLYGFIIPEKGLFGVTHEDAMHIRISMVVCAVWMLVFCLPLLLVAKNQQASTERQSPGLFGAYRELASSISHYWKTDRYVVWFLVSSALYRDGLAGVFAFGGVIAGRSFGFDDEEVLMFGIAANLVAGVATVIFGHLDDFLGSRRVIIFSLSAMCLLGLGVFFAASGGKIVFWSLGLGLCIFVGPTQAASRSYLARIAPLGEAGKIFGLYATTGRAVSFLAPWMYATSITLAATLTSQGKETTSIYGILGIVLVLLLGLLAFVPVKMQPRMDKADL